MTSRVLFVCLGNICRSPMAEAVLRAKAPALGIDSAGTSDWHVGAPPDPRAIREAAARGYDLKPLRARQVTAADFGRFDLILGMDSANMAQLARLDPGTGPARLERFLDYGGSGLTDLPDPYYDDSFDRALDLIEDAADGLIARLGRG